MDAYFLLKKEKSQVHKFMDLTFLL